MTVRFAIKEVALFERDTPFTRAFRFGAVTVTRAPQAFVKVTIETEAGLRAVGWTAEMMMPKWFDKRVEKSPEATIVDLKRGLAAAGRAAVGRGIDTGFGHSLAGADASNAFARDHDIAALSACFGPSVIDKAVLDALARALGIGFVEALRVNAVGLDARATPDLTQEAIEARLRALEPRASIALRHTIGMVDELEGPGSLSEDLDASDLRFFKIKLRGEPAADHARVAAIAALLERRGIGYQATVDANEQYQPEGLSEWWQRVARDRALDAFRQRLLLIEQPVDRFATFAAPLALPNDAPPVIIDEADDRLSAFPEAAALGYRGVSSKLCKGLYKALLNAARVATMEPHGLMSGEDLTCQAGLAVQQDSAFVAALGLGHVERNGHHYVDGFGVAPDGEAAGFRDAHPGLYENGPDGRPRLATASGQLDLSSLAGAGFATAAVPSETDLQPLGA